jgi:hypothetical protein
MGVLAKAGADEIEDWFLKGDCHVFAIALSRLTGLPMAGLAPSRRWVDNGLGWLHVYVDLGDGVGADVRGVRPVAEMAAELRSLARDMAGFVTDPVDEGILLAMSGDSWERGPDGRLPVYREIRDWVLADAEELIRGRLAPLFAELPAAAPVACHGMR